MQAGTSRRMLHFKSIAHVRFTVIPYIGPEIAQALRSRQSSPELAPPVLSKYSGACQNTSEPISFPHMLASVRHSNALVAIMELVRRCFL